MKNSLKQWFASGCMVVSAVMSAPVSAQSPAPAAAPQTRAQMLFGDVNPTLAKYTDDLLFGEVWKRPGLSPRDRSLVTVSALISTNPHLAFYTGWPNAVSASMIAKEVFQKK